MTPEQIAAVRERTERVPPGPWQWELYFNGEHPDWLSGPGQQQVLMLHEEDEATDGVLEFIARAREDVPTLLDEIAFLTEHLDRANADYEACVQSHQKVNMNHDVMLGLLCDLEDAEQQGTVAMPGALWQRIKAFLDSE